ncbi:scopoletin glucosyltransferase-like [Iris pallida]|uniref:Scopoletin glucosyltransferase-like n=1 Tax=Iris pallida TaxID=29817 RepID=A0AAX6DK59_IRIPA|nr:scopoletin glucosyltransferase-like [Iris pallida]
MDETIQVETRGTATAYCFLRHPTKLSCSVPSLLPVVSAAHQPAYGSLYSRSSHQLPLFVLRGHALDPHRHPDPQHVHNQPLVEELVGKLRPGGQRQPRAHPLQRRVPPAVRHEPPYRTMAQYRYLRRPSPQNQTLPRDPLLVSFWHP